MITSIFSKSKPINLIIVSVFIALVFVISSFGTLFSATEDTLKAIAKLLVVVFSLFLLDFIVAKNNLTKKNGYAIMTFGLLIGMFPTTLKFSNLLFANLFVLFALRRLISLHSNLHIKKKLFDAGFWIMLATLFYFWAILFFALVVVALIYHSKNDIKNVITPFVGVATVIILFSAYSIIIDNTYFDTSYFQRFSSLDFTAYNTNALILKLTVLFTAFVWILLYFFRIIPDKNKKLKPSFFLIAWASIIAILVAIISPVKNGSEFVFLFAPFSIIMANYIEVISEKWFKEIFVVLLLVTPFIALLL